MSWPDALSPWDPFAAVTLLIWLYLAFLRGGFWLADQRLPSGSAQRADWPDIVAVVPARDEAETIGRSVLSLLAQDYAGNVTVVVVDDHSADGTSNVAMRAARSLEAEHRLSIVPARELPTGWTGKVWAMAEGLAAAQQQHAEPRYVLFADADIEHDTSSLRRLVGKAEGEGRDLVSLMVRLQVQGAWDRLLIPAFVFFFQMLCPFAWVNDPKRRSAAAAGGVMLVRLDALRRMGGLECIHDALIDDCALARALKAPAGQGSIWLGLTRQSQSIRAYAGLEGIWHMVARSAYAQLRHSPLLLLGTMLGMFATYLAPPVLVLALPLHGAGPAAGLGLASWLLMAATYLPSLRLYDLPRPAAFLLPVAAAFYCAMTVDSALRHWRGAGGRWKGRLAPERSGPS